MQTKIDAYKFIVNSLRLFAREVVLNNYNQDTDVLINKIEIELYDASLEDYLEKIDNTEICSDSSITIFIPFSFNEFNMKSSCKYVLKVLCKHITFNKLEYIDNILDRHKRFIQMIDNDMFDYYSLSKKFIYKDDTVEFMQALLDARKIELYDAQNKMIANNLKTNPQPQKKKNRTRAKLSRFLARVFTKN